MYHVSKVELDRVRCERVEKPIERRLSCSFEVAQDTDYFVDRRFVQRPPRSIDEQSLLIVELYVIGQIHRLSQPVKGAAPTGLVTAVLLDLRHLWRAWILIKLVGERA